MWFFWARPCANSWGYRCSTHVGLFTLAVVFFFFFFAALCRLWDLSRDWTQSPTVKQWKSKSYHDIPLLSTSQWLFSFTRSYRCGPNGFSGLLPPWGLCLDCSSPRDHSPLSELCSNITSSLSFKKEFIFNFIWLRRFLVVACGI